MKRRELIDLLKALLQALAESETPKPRPPRLTPQQATGDTIYCQGDSWYTLDAHGQRQALTFTPHGYQADEDGGLWRPWSPDEARWR